MSKPTEKFKCLQCGRCCIAAGPTLWIDKEDVEKWVKEKRIDILNMLKLGWYICKDCHYTWSQVQIIYEKAHKGKKEYECPFCGKIATDVRYYWITENRCPFLKKIRNEDKYICKIHSSQPEDCSGFPCFSKQSIEECIKWKCKGYSKFLEENQKNKVTNF